MIDKACCFLVIGWLVLVDSCCVLFVSVVFDSNRITCEHSIVSAHCDWIYFINSSASVGSIALDALPMAARFCNMPAPASM